MKLSVKRAKELGIPVPPKKSWTDGMFGRKKSRQRDGDTGGGDAQFLAACKAHGLPAPVAEYAWGKAHDVRDAATGKVKPYRADYLFGGFVMVEQVGGVWVRGHHSRGKNQIDDMARRNLAQMLGYVVLEFTPQQMGSGEACAIIRRALAGEGEQP